MPEGKRYLHRDWPVDRPPVPAFRVEISSRSALFCLLWPSGKRHCCSDLRPFWNSTQAGRPGTQAGRPGVPIPSTAVDSFADLPERLVVGSNLSLGVNDLQFCVGKRDYLVCFLSVHDRSDGNGLVNTLLAFGVEGKH